MTKQAKNLENRTLDPSIWRQIIETLSDEVLVLSPEKNILVANPAFLSRAELSLDEVVGKKCYEVNYGLQSACQTPDKTCPLDIIGEENPNSLLHTHISKKGQTFAQVKASALRNSRGEIIAYVHTSRDVTKEEHDRRLIQDNVIGLYTSTRDGEFINANQAWLRMLGYESLKELQSAGNIDMMYTNPRDRDQFLRELEHSSYVHDREIILKHKEGSEVHIMINARIFGEYIRGAGVLSSPSSDLIPICSACKDIRKDSVWLKPDIYFRQEHGFQFTHGMCPDCMTEYFPGVQIPKK